MSDEHERAGEQAWTGRFDARSEIADSLRRHRAWQAEMRSKGLARSEALRIASGQQQHEMWQIEQHLTAPDAAEAERRIKDAEPGFQARQRAIWNELMDIRAHVALEDRGLAGHPFVPCLQYEPAPYRPGIAGDPEAEPEIGP